VILHFYDSQPIEVVSAKPYSERKLMYGDWP